MAVEIAGHVEADVRTGGVLGHRTQQRPAVVDRLHRLLVDRHEMIEEPYVVEAGRVGHAPGVALHRDRVDLLRELQSDADDQSLQGTSRFCSSSRSSDETWPSAASTSSPENIRLMLKSCHEFQMR